MKRDRPNAGHPMEFKVEAVRLYRESGKSLREIADDLGVSTDALRGLAPMGQRLYGEFVRNHGVNRSLISAMGFDGMLPATGSAWAAI